MDPFPDQATPLVFWLPEDDTGIVLLGSAPASLIPIAETLPLPAVAETRIDEQGVHSLLRLGQHSVIQVLATGPAPVAAIIPLDHAAFGRLEALHRLLAAIHRRAIPLDSRITPQQRARAKRMLRAADGARDGATQQDIARIIFRIGDIDRDEWQASSARHAVKSLLRDARALISGGYLRLLRHRHRA